MHTATCSKAEHKDAGFNQNIRCCSGGGPCFTALLESACSSEVKANQEVHIGCKGVGEAGGVQVWWPGADRGFLFVNSYHRCHKWAHELLFDM